MKQAKAAGTCMVDERSSDLIVGIDVAARMFQLHVSAPGGMATRQQLKREALIEYVEKLPKGAVVAMEACSGTHHWGRVFRSMGHEVRLIPCQHVKPFVRTNKSDRADALAIWEAAQRPALQLVRIKTEDEQAVMLLHHHRSQLLAERIRNTNRLRGAMHEYGIVLNCGWKSSLRRAKYVVADTTIPGAVGDLVAELVARAEIIQESIDRVELNLRRWAGANDLAGRYMQIPGIGILTATAIAATVGSGESYVSARNFSAAVGLVPSHSGTGGVTRIGRLSKRGNRYLKRLLVLAGLRRIIVHVPSADPWLDALLDRKPTIVAAIAIANKLARIMWAMARKGSKYDHAMWCRPAKPPT